MPTTTLFTAYTNRLKLSLYIASHELHEAHQRNLASKPIRHLIARGFLTPEEASVLHSFQKLNLESESIRNLIVQNMLPISHALALTIDQSLILQSHAICDLVMNNRLPLSRALTLTATQRIALEDPDIRENLRNGTLTLQHIIGDMPEQINLNDAQSTHTASVHKTTAESATRLLQRYGHLIAGDDLERVITQIQTHIQARRDECHKNQAAKRCIERITAITYDFTEHTCEISTRQLLALTFLAIHDETQRLGTEEDATTQFVEGLYEIQRGYNLSENGIDNHALDDHPICSAGTFNKLIEKLQGIHPDCHIHFITHEMAALKLPIVVRETVRTYLLSLPERHPTWDVTEIAPLISALQKEGVSPIWDYIKDPIADRLFDEFGSLYRTGKNSGEFNQFVETSLYVTLQDLTDIQQQLQDEMNGHASGNRHNWFLTERISQRFKKYEMPKQQFLETLTHYRHCLENPSLSQQELLVILNTLTQQLTQPHNPLLHWVSDKNATEPFPDCVAILMPLLAHMDMFRENAQTIRHILLFTRCWLTTHLSRHATRTYTIPNTQICVADPSTHSQLLRKLTQAAILHTEHDAIATAEAQYRALRKHIAEIQPHTAGDCILQPLTPYLQHYLSVLEPNFLLVWETYQAQCMAFSNVILYSPDRIVPNPPTVDQYVIETRTSNRTSASIWEQHIPDLFPHSFSR
ncbi:MAG: hypothetical protein A3J38_03400 [Gammaproteobacteria bacterium RIFCSPHIGHO2_12_FULL_45_9]|nr:MAG: hypothetical protein A3J38_03400 [Gammaproteobacteria bacterium RIFCSPHIGHO2_12_FULL_45_9]